MTNAFAAAIDALFADPNLGWDAVYTTPGGDPIPVRVFRHQPDAVLAFGETRLHTTTAIFDVRISEVAEPRAGDSLVVEGEAFVIQGTPRRDDGRLIWTVRGAQPMRLEAAIRGDLTALLMAELRNAEKAVTAGVREATTGLKTELRRQITSAGLGTRLANTWRGEVYPNGQPSIAAAGFVWSKAPGIVRLYAEGAVIRSKRGLYLAIPTPAAGRFADGRTKITPGAWERIHRQDLRFIYRRSGPSLLVADNVRLSGRGRAVSNIGRRQGAAYTRLSGRTTVPVFILVPQVTVRKRLDVDGAARRWFAALPRLIGHAWPIEERRHG